MVLTKAMKIKYDLFETPEFYDKYTRVSSNIMSCVTEYIRNFTMLIGSVISSAVALSIVIQHKIWIAVPLMVIGALNVIWFIKQSRAIYANNVSSTPIYRRLSMVNDFFLDKKTISDLKANDGFEFYENKTDEIYGQVIDNQKKKTKISYIWDNATSGVDILSNIAVVGYSAVMVMKKLLTIGNFTLVTGASKNLYEASKSFASIIGCVVDQGMKTKEIYEFMETEEERYSKKNKPLTPNGRDIIEVKNLSFSYSENSNFSLSNISFSIKQGEKVCIVGKNGAGKSTLAKLIMGLYQDYSGEIGYCGRNAEEINCADIRDMFSCVMQNYCKFPFSLTDNIIISDSKAKKDILFEKAVSESGVANYAETLRDKYDTILNKSYMTDGTDLSEGQWRKLAIARSMYRQRPVLLADEPTDSLDPMSEKQIFDYLMSDSDGRTAIIISHRLSCCLKADKIIVLDGGKIVGIGKHEELITTCPVYERLFNEQASGYTFN